MNFLGLFRSATPSKRSRFPSLLRRATRPGPNSRAALDSQSDVLTELAHSWARKFPLQSRPLELCNVYPRVANRIAECWDDVAATEVVLDDLLVDHRGGRNGFPAQIAIELLRLQKALEERTRRMGPDKYGPSAM